MTARDEEKHFQNGVRALRILISEQLDTLGHVMPHTHNPDIEESHRWEYCWRCRIERVMHLPITDYHLHALAGARIAGEPRVEKSCPDESLASGRPDGAEAQLRGGESGLSHPAEIPASSPLPDLKQTCMDCQRDYSLSLIFNRVDWLRINPIDGGLLCAYCSLERAAKLAHILWVKGQIVTSENLDELHPLARVPDHPTAPPIRNLTGEELRNVYKTVTSEMWREGFAGEHEDIWNAIANRVAALRWKCKARSANTGANDPQDCDWPTCGCDPHADRVIEALQESGKLLGASATPAPSEDENESILGLIIKGVKLPSLTADEMKDQDYAAGWDAARAIIRDGGFSSPSEMRQRSNYVFIARIIAEERKRARAGAP
jgi:hypothetical protein